MQATETASPMSGVEPDTDSEEGDVPSGAPDPSNGIAVAYVYQESVEYSWHHSVIEMIGWDLAHHCRLMQGGYIAIHHGTDGLVQARNLAVMTFLEDRPFADWMLWIDTDMGFAPETADRLLEVADPVARPVVGGLCFAQRQVAPDGMGGWTCRAQPTIFDWQTHGSQQGFVARLDYPRDTVTRVSGTGSACLLIHRSAFERVQAKYGQSWYSRVPNHSMGEMTSEDLSFCMKLGSCGVPVHVHTGVRTSHRKSVWVGESEYEGQPPFVPPVPPGVAVARTPVPAPAEPAENGAAADALDAAEVSADA